MLSSEMLIFAGIFIVSLGAIWLIFRKFSARVAPSMRKIAVTSIAVYILLRIATFFEGGPGLYGLIGVAFAPGSAMAEIALIVAALAFVKGWRPELLTDSSLPSDGEDVIIRRKVREILDSNEFLTALNESLPKGATDAEHGIDYVPYLLTAIRKRRDRFEISARRFLRLTVALGVASAAIIAGFGWIILDDSSVGAPRAIHDVRRTLDQLASSARNIIPSIKASAEYQRLLNVLRQDAGDKLATLRGELLVAAETSADEATEIQSLVNRLKITAAALQSTEREGRTFKVGLANAAHELDAVLTRQQQLHGTVQSATVRLARLLPLLEAGIGKDDSRVAELIKRIAVGLIVATFFLALVRFMGGLYRADYTEVLRADLDDLFARSYYIAFKSAGSNASQRSAAVTNLLNMMTSLRVDRPGKDTPHRLRKEELAIVQELVSAAAKKL